MKSVKKMMIGIMAAALMVTGFAGCKKDSTAEKFDGSFPQFTEPEQGEDIAVMTVKGYGTIKILFFQKTGAQSGREFYYPCKRRVLQ